jgi:hypothetical protein
MSSQHPIKALFGMPGERTARCSPPNFPPK